MRPWGSGYAILRTPSRLLYKNTRQNTHHDMTPAHETREFAMRFRLVISEPERFEGLPIGAGIALKLTEAGENADEPA